MKKTLLEIYALVVCLFSVVFFVIVLGIAVWNSVSLANPDFALDNRLWEAHQSDAAYATFLEEKYFTSDADKYQPPTGAELTSQRQSSLALAIRAESRGSLQELSQNLITLLISLVVFAVHWKIAAGARHPS